MTMVTITNGTYRGEEVHNQTFEMVADHKITPKNQIITVKPNNEIYHGNKDKLRITVSAENIQYHGPRDVPAIINETIEVQSTPEETDAEIIERIQDRFDILGEMTDAAINAQIKGMIVVGPPGVGKSYGVMQQLEKANMFRTISNEKSKFDIIKGTMSAIGLYIKLYMNRHHGQVILFDDCDSILQDEDSLNLLKAALNSSKKRKLCWNKDSRALKDHAVPDNFDFAGSVIFITNVKFDNIRSKKLQDHLAAIQSRCHYLDLSMNTMRDCMLRVKHIHSTGELFKEYNFNSDEGDKIIAYMETNKNRLREISLRMAVKIADLTKASKNWKRLAESTVMKHSF